MGKRREDKVDSQLGSLVDGCNQEEARGHAWVPSNQFLYPFDWILIDEGSSFPRFNYELCAVCYQYASVHSFEGTI